MVTKLICHSLSMSTINYVPARDYQRTVVCKRVNAPYRPYTQDNPPKVIFTQYPVIWTMSLMQGVDRPNDFLATRWDEMVGTVKSHFVVWFSKVVDSIDVFCTLRCLYGPLGFYFFLCSFGFSFFCQSFGFTKFCKQTMMAMAKSAMAVYMCVIVLCLSLCCSFQKQHLEMVKFCVFKRTWIMMAKLFQILKLSYSFPFGISDSERQTE